MADRDDVGREHTPTGAETAGAAAGGLGGAAIGAGVGSALGPLGTAIGAIAGALGGWWTGDRLTEIATQEFGNEEHRFREHHATSRHRRPYEAARPAYQLGYVAGRNPEYRGRTFDEVEPDLRRGWTGDLGTSVGDWSAVRSLVSQGFGRGQERTVTLAEEELAVGKREVKAGEVTIRKVVDTEHVVKRVPVKREEVIIERRPADGVRAAEGTEIREQEIRIPIVDEELVVEKRTVPKEELVVRKAAVEEAQTVEADLRKERASVDDTSRRSRSVGSGEDEVRGR
jgi:uncharacterized protein (TIGR02271 family)